MAQFRFEKLDIWKNAIEIGNHLFDIADILDDQKKYRFAEQLRGAGLSISNNIAEGAGGSNREFNRYLGIARISIYENANMLKVFELRGFITKSQSSNLLKQLETLSRQITSLRKTLQ